jgi:predicted PurR-regulated permease PerM
MPDTAGPGAGAGGSSEPATSPGHAAARAEAADLDAREAAHVAAEEAARGQRLERHPLGLPGAPLASHSPFYIGFLGAAGAVLAVWLGQQLQSVSSSLLLIVVSAFLAVGLSPSVAFLQRRGLGRGWAVLAVTLSVLAALTLFVVALVPVISDQVTALTRNVPQWLDALLENERVQQINEKYEVVDNVRDYVANGDFASAAFGGVLGIGIAVLSALANTFIIVVLTLYFLGSLPTITRAMYTLAPASRRERVELLGDRILASIGAYVAGAFLVAVAAGVSSLVFLFAVGLGEYAVALAFVVALLDVIPMIGATLGAVLVSAIGFATDVRIGIASVIFYLIYQQIENYVVYPRVMSRSVDLPGALIVVAALLGAGLLGVVGALLAIPTAAAILLLVKEVFIRRQDAR